MLEFTTLSNEDKGQWKSLRADYGAGDDYGWDDSKAEIVWGWLNDPNHSLECMVAKDDAGQLIGFIQYRESPHAGHAANYGYIEDLYVTPEYRRKGIAANLIERVKEIGQRQGWKFLRWTTYGDNAEAQKLYDKIARRKDRLVYQLDI